MKWKFYFYPVRDKWFHNRVTTFYMFQPSPSPNIPNIKGEGPVFTVQTSKQHMNTLIRDYIQRHGKKVNCLMMFN